MSLKNNRTRTLVLSLLLVAACVGVASCGGSSTSSSTGTNAAATNTAPTGSTGVPTGPTGVGPTGASGRSARFSALRECLQKNGVTLPSRAPGQGPPRGGFLGGATGGQLPPGVSREKLEAAMKKCGASGRFARFGRSGGSAGFLRSPRFSQALTKFAACMRENGVNLPPPNTSGSGPIFDTKGIDTRSPQFASAEAKCRSDLSGALRSGATGG
jgi:hypothetical protein